MPAIMRSELKEFIQDTEGHIFTATFIKKDNTIRTMNCRKGVHKNLKGGVNNAALSNTNLSIVYDMQIGEYRMINLATVLYIKYQKQLFTIMEDV
jgi:hypothetical protein